MVNDFKVINLSFALLNQGELNQFAYMHLFVHVEKLVSITHIFTPWGIFAIIYRIISRSKAEVSLINLFRSNVIFLPILQRKTFFSSGVSYFFIGKAWLF